MKRFTYLVAVGTTDTLIDMSAPTPEGVTVHRTEVLGVDAEDAYQRGFNWATSEGLLPCAPGTTANDYVVPGGIQ